MSSYIYKDECLSVCLFAIRFYTVQPISMKLSRNGLYTQAKVDVHFDKKTNPVKLTNRITVFQRIEIDGSEGGRRSSERLSRGRSE